MSTETAEVDVAVVTWNTREVTLDALAALGSALFDTATPGVRVLVRDNGSTDGTAEAIAATFPDIELDAGGENLGFAGGVNTILRRSRAKWVLLLNSDAWPEPGAIDQLVACGDRHPHAAAIAPRLLRPDDTLEPSTWPFPSLRVAARAALRPLRYVWPHDRERSIDWAVGAALLIRRTALDEIGALDDSLFMYAEDLDWCWRAREAGWQVWFTPDAVVRHIGNASGSKRYGARQPAAWIANSIIVYRRRHSAIATGCWQAVNSLGAVLAARRASKAGNSANEAHWRSQVRPWLGRSGAVE
jgi:GT2 family glycosyltransferase